MDTSLHQAERPPLLEATQARRVTDSAIGDAAREVEDLYENAPCGYQSLDGSAMFLDAALAEIEASKGRGFDPEVVAACVALYRRHGFNLDTPPPDGTGV
jgi:hypothetical protein